MKNRMLEWRVGLFVFLTLAIMAGLLIRFSKGTTFFRETYALILKTSNVGGLRQRASVLLAGVPIGSVSEIHLSPGSTNVLITLKIYSQFTIRDDAEFHIEQMGFLGDQFVSVNPGKNQGTPLKPGAEANVTEPFNLQQVARDASGFIQRIDETARTLNDAIRDVRRELLNEKTLTNLVYSIEKLQKVTDEAALLMTNLNMLVTSNGVPVGQAVSNLVTFSEKLNGVAQSAQNVVNTNQEKIGIAVSNLQTSTAMLTNLLADANSGKGLLGFLLHNDSVASNVSSLSSNLAVTSGYLRSNSFWHFLFNAPPTNAPATDAKPKK